MVVIKVGNGYRSGHGNHLASAKITLIGRHYTQRQIDGIMDPLSDVPPESGIYVSNDDRTLYKFTTTPHTDLNLIELLGVAENTPEGLKELM